MDKVTHVTYVAETINQCRVCAVEAQYMFHFSDCPVLECFIALDFCILTNEI
jgi:hypothetical protein